MAREYLIVLSPLAAAAAGIAVLFLTMSGAGRSLPVPEVPFWQCRCNDAAGTSSFASIAFKGLRPLSESPFLHDAEPGLSETPEAIEPEALRLTMILQSGRQRLCRINGAIFRAGEEGPGFVVEHIGSFHVEIVTDTGARKVLYLDDRLFQTGDETNG